MPFARAGLPARPLPRRAVPDEEPTMGEYVMTTISIGGTLTQATLTAFVAAAQAYYPDADERIAAALADGTRVTLEAEQNGPVANSGSGGRRGCPPLLSCFVRDGKSEAAGEQVVLLADGPSTREPEALAQP